MWFLATPVGGAGIAAGKHTGAQQLVASETGEESLTSRVKTVHRYITVERPLGEDTAQYEGCREMERGMSQTGGHGRDIIKLRKSEILVRDEVRKERWRVLFSSS